MITSTSNQQIKNITALLKKKKERDLTNSFVVEGRRFFDEIGRAGRKPKQVYISESFPDANEAAYANAEVVSDKVFKEISETVTPQGIIAIVEKPSYDLETEIKRGARRFLILEDIQDPGNLGTMIRTAEAAGVDLVIMTKGTVDIFSPKVTRSTMGSIFRVPFVYTEDLGSTIEKLKENGVKVYGSTLPSSVDFRTVDYGEKSAVIVGNEGNGMSDEAVSMCDGCVHIPMAGEVESLNAAVAASLLMFEMNRRS